MKRIEHKDGKFRFSFVEYSPEVKKENLPLIVQLHGAGERGNGQEDLPLVDVNGFSKILKDDTTHECIVIMPQCPTNSFWAAHVESILAFIEELKSAYSVDESRIYLTGISMGGFGTWYTAMAKPELFAAIAPVCGGGMAWNAAVLTMPIWTFHSSDDDTVSVSQTDEMVAKLKELNYDVKYTRRDDCGHGVWNIAYNEELLDWLLSKKK